MSRDGFLTIGVEEEYQIIDASGQLHSHIDTLLAAAAPKLGDKVKREMMQSVVEVGTTVCENVDEARYQLGEMRHTLSELLKPEGLRIACAGTHPFSRWEDQQITEHERYKMLEIELQDVVRRISLLAQKNAPLRLAFAEGELTVSAQTPDVGEASEKIPVAFHGEPLEIGFNPDFLRDGLESVESGDVVLKLISPLRPGLLAAADDSGFHYLIMPIRLNV